MLTSSPPALSSPLGIPPEKAFAYEDEGSILSTREAQGCADNPVDTSSVPPARRERAHSNPVGTTLSRRLPFAVLLISLLCLLFPLLVLAQGEPVAPTTSAPQLWAAIVASLIGALSGGGSLYRQQSMSAGIDTRLTMTETRLKSLEDSEKGLPDRFIRRDELAAFRSEMAIHRQEQREDLRMMRAELDSLRNQFQTIARQNEQIITILDNLGKT